MSYLHLLCASSQDLRIMFLVGHHVEILDRYYRQESRTFDFIHLFRSSHPEVFLSKSILRATLLKSHFGTGFLLYICCIFSEHLFLRTSLDSCFCLFTLYLCCYHFDKDTGTFISYLAFTNAFEFFFSIQDTKSRNVLNEAISLPT